MKVNNGVARLGAPQSTREPKPPQAGDRYSILFPLNSATGIDFTLELFLDLEDRIYSVSLVNPDGTVDILPMDQESALPSLWPQTSVGAALVRKPTSGHVAMDLHTFAVYGVFPTRRRASSLLALVRRALWRWVIAPSPFR
jgi:hypothetical protein